MMSLPKLETPKFTTELPSTGETVSYRPFLVKEQKILLMAQKSEKEAEIVTAMRDIVDVCTFEVFKDRKLPSFDIQYLFLQIRARSVGERLPIKFAHHYKKDGSECGHEQTIQIDLSKVYAKKDEKHTANIQLTDKLGLTMRYPTVEEQSAQGIVDEDIDAYLDLCARCVEKVYGPDEVWANSPSMYAEMKEFIENFTEDQFAEVINFFKTMPTIKYDLKYKCEGCGETVEHTVEGMSDFF